MPEHGCSSGGGSSCRRGNLASRFLLWTSQISRQSWVRLIPGSVAALVTTAGAAEGAAVGRKQAGVGTEGLSVSPRARWGREEEGRKRLSWRGEIVMERRGKTKTKSKSKLKTSRHAALTGRDEIHVLAECVEQEPLKAGGEGTGLEPTCLTSVSHRLLCPPSSRAPTEQLGSTKCHKPLHRDPQVHPSLRGCTGTRPGGCPQVETQALGQGSPVLPKALCSLGQTWGTGNPRDHLP